MICFLDVYTIFLARKIIYKIVENYFKTTTALHKSPTFYFRLIFLGENRA